MDRDTTVLTVLLLLLGLTAFLYLTRPSGRHRRKIRTAWKVHDRILAIDKENGDRWGHGWLEKYLRKIDPYVFEELALLCLKDNGYATLRNSRYSGDGGIDGRARKGRKRYLIQCKRYSGTIKVSHVREFERLCRKRHRHGLFIHTGTTGKESDAIFRNSRRISDIGGETLYRLMTARNRKKT